jgi:hypothetical protein
MVITKINSLSLIAITILLNGMQSYAAVVQKNNEPAINIKKVNVNDETVQIAYEIINNSTENMWILKGFGKYGSIFSEPFVDEDGQTLILRARLDSPKLANGGAIYGRYVLLRAGQKQTETVCIPIPAPIFMSLASTDDELGVQGLAKRLVIEIGYYVGDLPAIVHGILEEAENVRQKKTADNPAHFYITNVDKFFGGFLAFNETNEILRFRDEEIIIPDTDRIFKGEKYLQLVITDLNIPYKEIYDLETRNYPPGLTFCTRIEIHYEPSLLEYFFPYKFQQSFLNTDELNYLRSVQNIIVENQDKIQTFVDDVNNVLQTEGIVRQSSSANMVFYRGNERISSFCIYDDFLVTKDMNRFIRLGSFKSLFTITPNIQAIESRIECATNMNDVWHRLRLYQRAMEEPDKILSNKITYPQANKWCDAMKSGYNRQTSNGYRRWNMIQLVCPSSNEGKCNYAMNPNCKPDSPGDMVLLFETKAGWNQHGGPELFTFDNHDPKGGCVLFNDGTVKFIRTEEELKNLRWK